MGEELANGRRPVEEEAPVRTARRGGKGRRSSDASGALKYFVAEMARSEAETLLLEYGRHIDGAFLFRRSGDRTVV